VLLVAKQLGGFQQEQVGGALKAWSGVGVTPLCGKLRAIF